jgi:hypothetical protein
MNPKFAIRQLLKTPGFTIAVAKGKESEHE